MTPDERERLARSRFAMLSAMRASGVVLMLIGMWVWFGSLVRPGGYMPIGFPLFVLGFAESLILPTLVARRWHSPRR